MISINTTSDYIYLKTISLKLMALNNCSFQYINNLSYLFNFLIIYLNSTLDLEMIF